MSRLVFVLGALLGVVACSTASVPLGIIGDAPDAGTASLAFPDEVPDAGDPDAEAQRCPRMDDTRSFETRDRVLPALQGRWRICDGAKIWDAPASTVDIGILSTGAVYFYAPGSGGQSFLDTESRRNVSVLSPSTDFPTDRCVLEYGAGRLYFTVELSVASEGNQLTLRDRVSGDEMTFLRSAAPFL